VIFASKEFREDFQNKQGYKIIASLIQDTKQSASFSLCHVILSAILETYDNPNDFRPVNNALVSQVMNKSMIAKEIVNQTNLSMNRPKKSLMIHFELFEMFFKAVSLLDTDKTRCQLLKILQ